jgi:hypothetical protein
MAVNIKIIVLWLEVLPPSVTLKIVAYLTNCMHYFPYAHKLD